MSGWLRCARVQHRRPHRGPWGVPAVLSVGGTDDRSRPPRSHRQPRDRRKRHPAHSPIRRARGGGNHDGRRIPGDGPRRLLLTGRPTLEGVQRSFGGLIACLSALSSLPIPILWLTRLEPEGSRVGAEQSAVLLVCRVPLGQQLLRAPVTVCRHTVIVAARSDTLVSYRHQRVTTPCARLDRVYRQRARYKRANIVEAPALLVPASGAAA
jgi:hypothetical protein